MLAMGKTHIYFRSGRMVPLFKDKDICLTFLEESFFDMAHRLIIVNASIKKVVDPLCV